MKIRLTITIAVLMLGAQAEAQNFTGDAQAVGVAERSREALASFWFGERFRDWSAPCPITVRKAASASGSTKMIFDRGEVFGWKMSVGARSREELDSTAIPHEVSHAVFATRDRESGSGTRSRRRGSLPSGSSSDVLGTILAALRSSRTYTPKASRPSRS